MAAEKKWETGSLFDTRTFQVNKSAEREYKLNADGQNRFGLFQSLARSTSLARFSTTDRTKGDSKNYFFKQYKGEVAITDVTNWTGWA